LNTELQNGLAKFVGKTGFDAAIRRTDEAFITRGFTIIHSGKVKAKEKAKFLQAAVANFKSKKLKVHP
ncbi:MAG: hypothetical protein ACM3JI_00945, partial [Anaerolineae bacterium]